MPRVTSPRVKPFVAENRQGVWRRVGRIEGTNVGGVGFLYPVYKNGTDQLYIFTPGGQMSFRDKETLLGFLKRSKCTGRLTLKEGGEEKTEFF